MSRRIASISLRRRCRGLSAALAFAALFGTPGLRAQSQAASPAGADAVSAAAGGWSLHAQSTFVDQWHYAFPSPYEGPNSFSPAPEEEQTVSVSLYLGRSLWSGAALYYDPELFQGYGLSQVLGIAAFPSGEAIKSGFPHFHYNTSRLYFQQVIGLGGPTEKIDEGADQVGQEVDVDRLVLSVGKFAASDFFDANAYSQDSRTQFLNWALLASGAWDEPGDLLGFTDGAVVEWNTKNAELHYGILMEPTETNSASLDHRLDKAFGQILQYDIRYALPGGLAGTLRPFVYWNRAYMGLFSSADAEADPDIATTRAYRSKEGLGLSWDQALGASVGVFARLSWNDGRAEDIAYSDIDRSAAAGVSLSGSGWGRPGDTVGLAGAIDGLSPEHRRYLEEGGVGFVLGDGALDYGPEEIVEGYYSIALFGHVWLSPDWQYVEHPGYNRDRGGLSVYAVRAHVEF